MIAVFASGQGSNFEALADAFPGAMAAVVSNVEGAGVLGRAAARGIPTGVVPHTHFAQRAAHEKAMLQALAALLHEHDPSGKPLRLLVLAGYMRVLSETFLSGFAQRYPQARAWNLHPAHLDQYRGAHAFSFAVEHRFPRWGLSVHEVTAVLDGGALVDACEVPVWPTDSAASLHARARESEHALLVRAVRSHLFPG
ncbi:MAG: phosphoribosylglycinamide formyltransferase [Silvanigrellales bacterium]|jgi:phosphoribosylglycinamide formyltransferase-1|nr:phosphoribosylglycinamide formyltransferase [Silvanigrellales bacterium]